jgi:putative transposase
MSKKQLLKTEDLNYLQTFIKKGTHKAREITRAQVLLQINQGRSVESVAERVGSCEKTVRRIVGRYLKEGLKRAVFDAGRPGQPKKTTDKEDAHLVAIACTTAPKGNANWTVDLIMKKFQKDKGKKIGRTALWLRLKTRNIKPWREKNVVHTENYN